MSRIPRAALWLLDECLRAWFAPDCLICGRLVDREPICGGCALWSSVEPPWCRRCGASVTQSIKQCGACEENPLDEARSQFWFHGAARDLLHQVKFSGRSAWLGLFKASCHWPEEISLTDYAVVPVPLHPRRLWARGFNQSAHLARWIAEYHGAKLVEHGLEKLHDTESQSGLTRPQRQRNLAKAFRWRISQSVPDRVLLVDDVWTTGSTLFACARVLRRAGVKEIRAWTLFRTPLRLESADELPVDSIGQT